MASNKYTISESIARIDQMLKGQHVLAEGNTGEIFIKQRAMPIVVHQKKTLLLGKVDFNFAQKELERPQEVCAAVYNELREICASASQCQQVSVIGEKVIAVFDTPMKTDVNDVTDIVAAMCGIVDIINYKCSGFKQRKIRMRISVCYGMIDLIQYGDKLINGIADTGLIQEAQDQLEYEEEGSVVISRVIYNNLKDDYKKLFKYGALTDEPCHGNIINVGMSNWLENQKKNG